PACGWRWRSGWASRWAPWRSVAGRRGSRLARRGGRVRRATGCGTAPTTPSTGRRGPSGNPPSLASATVTRIGRRWTGSSPSAAITEHRDYRRALLTPRFDGELDVGGRRWDGRGRRG